MNAVTVSQPYASLIADGTRWIENRTWYTGHRGLLAIRAGKGTQYVTAAQLTKFPNGCIVAVARLVACVNLAQLNAGAVNHDLERSGITRDQLLAHQHTQGPWCWVLKDIRKLPVPHRCNGSQGLWDTPPWFTVPLINNQEF